MQHPDPDAQLAYPQTTFTPSVTSLQLLRNLGSIRDNLQEVGKVNVVRQLDRYIHYLQARCANDLEFIDYTTAAIQRVYQVLTPQERLQVFRDYRVAERFGLQRSYGPKAEIEYFCQQIEPEILALRRKDHASPSR